MQSNDECDVITMMKCRIHVTAMLVTGGVNPILVAIYYAHLVKVNWETVGAWV